jgi:hypothetical protein
MGVIVERLSDHYAKGEVATALDAMKNLCYRYASQSGLTVSIDDVKTPKLKREILDKHEGQADKVESQFRRGIITDGERRQQEVRIWTDATAEVQKAMEAEFKAAKFNPIDMMVGSGARGNMTQMRQIAGMRGLVANPRGDMIPRPIKKNFREGLEPSSTSSPPRVLVRASSTPHCVPPTRATSPVVWSTSRRSSSFVRSTAAATWACGSRTSSPTRPTVVATSRPSCSAVRCRPTSRWPMARSTRATC